MTPLAAAMTKTGTAQVIAETLMSVSGNAGPRVLLAGLYIVTLAITSFMSNTATALFMFPIAVAIASKAGISPLPFIISAAIGAHAALLAPAANPVNLLLLQPGGYKFTDYTKFGLPIAIWWLVAVLFIVPLHWRF